MNFRLISKVVGALALLLAGAMLLCDLYGWILSPVRETSSDFALMISAGICSTIGVLLAIGGRGGGTRILRKEAIAIVGLGWIFATFAGAVPYLLSEPALNPAQAIFESASGFTTTGSSVMVDVEIFPVEILLWRATTQWLGGGGILVLFVALLSALGVGSKSLFRHESTVQVSEGFYSRIRETAVRLWQIYLGLTGICIVGMMLLGASLRDAILFTFTCISTGGFAPYNSSVAHFGSPLIEMWLTLFMILGGTNFLLLAWLLRGRFSRPFHDEEFRLYLSLITLGTLIVLGSLLTRESELSFGTLARQSVFQVVSILTTTGFATADYELWPPLAQSIILVLMFAGGCVGSTAGSLKIQRLLIFGKNTVRQVVHAFRPQQVLRLMINGRVVSEDDKSSAVFYIALAGITMLVSIPVMELTNPGLELATTGSAIVTAFANVGPGFGEVGPMENFSVFGPSGLLILAFLMILGRLEMFAILALFVPSLWKKY